MTPENAALIYRMYRRAFRLLMNVPIGDHCLFRVRSIECDYWRRRYQSRPDSAFAEAFRRGLL